MEYYYYNLSNINEKNGKIYFLLSRTNKDGKVAKQIKCHEINSPTIQSLLSTLQLSSIQGLINLDNAQDNDLGIINIGVCFTNGGISWSSVGIGKKQKWYGPYMYSQDWLDRWVGEQQKFKVDEKKIDKVEQAIIIPEQKIKTKKLKEISCNTDGSKNYRVKDMNDIYNIGDNDYIILE